MGVRQGTVSAWLSGKTVPKFSHVCRAARLLGVDVGSLCDPAWLDAAPELDAVPEAEESDE